VINFYSLFAVFADRPTRPDPITRLVATILLLLAMITLPAQPALATATTELVAERAITEFGAAMPVGGRFEVRLAGDLPQDGEFISDFWIDKKSGQFIANLITTKGDTSRIWGVAVLTVAIPVPTRRMLPDEIIGEMDIEIIEMPWQRVNAYAVLTADELVGKQVRRMLNQGRPVQLQSVIPPIVIKRGQKVTIEYYQGPLYLTAEGKAIADAYLGQEVKVVNLASKMTIVGIALGDGKVEASY
jgi:flagellar basal body P-ring formation protein FlgA